MGEFSLPQLLILREACKVAASTAERLSESGGLGAPAIAGREFRAIGELVQERVNLF